MRKNINTLFIISLIVALLFVACESKISDHKGDKLAQSESKSNKADELTKSKGSKSTKDTEEETEKITKNISDEKVTLLAGSGATFPRPLYDEMFLRYSKETGIKVNYAGVGSSKGISELKDKVVEFGGTDAFMSDKDLAESTGTILHIPTAIGAVAIAFNIDGVDDLNLSGELISDIFMGKITKWNDPKLTAINKDAALPDLDIQVMHRAEGSGTTFTFSDYLSKVSKEWEIILGRGKEINWPVGLGGKGNPGVTQLIQTNNGSIGYFSLEYALKNNISIASVRNKSGKFIMPSLESVSLAAQGDISADTRVSITDTSFVDGYPISTFTWLIFYKEQSYDGRSKAQARALSDLLMWVIHDGQEFNEDLNYAKLPGRVIQLSENIISSMLYGGSKLR